MCVCFVDYRGQCDEEHPQKCSHGHPVPGQGARRDLHPLQGNLLVMLDTSTQYVCPSIKTIIIKFYSLCSY